MRALFFALVGLLACSPAVQEPLPEDTDLPEDVEPVGAAVYALDHLLEVEITMPPADWDAMRVQARSFQGFWEGEDCMDQPFDSPFTWFTGTVKIDGEEIEEVGIRKKGFFGSVDPNRPSVKLDFDRHVDGRRWMGLERLTLNNNRQDPSRIRACMGYHLFADADMPASRCNFAHVIINGQDMGVYANVEPVKEAMLRRAFDSDEGALYEGTFSDFRDGWLGTFEQKTKAANPEQLEAVAQALTLPDDKLVAALDELMDVDQFIEFWVMESILNHWDGYGGNRNNYFVYVDPADGRLRFIPWGIDAIFTNDRPFGSGDPGGPIGVYANGTLAYRAARHPELHDRFFAQMRTTLDTLWDGGRLEARRVEMRDIIDAKALGGAEYEQTMTAVKDFIATRKGDLVEELDAGWPRLPGTWPEFNNCQPEVGRVKARFESTWGSTDLGAPWTQGTGSIEMWDRGEPVPVTFLGTTVGPWRTDNIIAISGELESGATIMLIATARNPTALFVSGSYNADGSDFGMLMTQDDDGGHDSYRVVGSPSGTLELDQVSDVVGEPVSGVLEVATFGRR